MTRIVVVGAGLAGHRSVGALRRRGFEGEVIVVGDEVHPPYDRPPLSKKALAGAMEPGDCAFRIDDLDATWRLGQGAVGLDVAAGEVQLAGGEALAFDGLVIATGRRARPWAGLPDLEGFHSLRSLDDTLRMKGSVAQDSRVAIVGAGFIGCEVAATLRDRGVDDVTLIDVAPHPMPLLGAEVGERASRLHADRGVRLRLDASVASFEGDGRVEAVVLEDGERLAANVVLIAVGSAPNSEWLAGSGLELVDGSVLCDEFCVAVGTENVVVAGDVASWPHSGVGQVVRIEHWTNARDMAEAAAANLLSAPDERVAYAPVPTFWSDQYDVKIKSVGFVTLADRFVVVDEDEDRPALVVEAHRGGTLLGAIAFNRNRTILEYQRTLARAAAV